MALSAKTDLRLVPWFSRVEWQEVFSGIYSMIPSEQKTAYNRLLIWKARMPKLPVGIDCTLAILQVCLRDRDWTPRINNAELPISYEGDLSLMYSTTIMRFLNQVSNVGHTRQTSMFQIAKQLKIPEWIVTLRHDAAHGHCMPPIGTLRMAANILLRWLRAEYWEPEAKAMSQGYARRRQPNEESYQSQNFVVYLELWIAVGLYVKSRYETVCDIPDPDLVDLLCGFCAISPDSKSTASASTVKRKISTNQNYDLREAHEMLLRKLYAMSRYAWLGNMDNIVIKTILESEAFFPDREIMGIFLSKSESSSNLVELASLPLGMTEFWQDLIALIHKKKLLEEFIERLISIVHSEIEEHAKRLLASLWLKAIFQALLRLGIVQKVSQAWEPKDGKRRVGTKTQAIRNELDKVHPEISSAMMFHSSVDIPEYVTSIHCAERLLFIANEYTRFFIQPVLDIATPPISSKRKDKLMKLLRLHTRCIISKTAVESTKDNSIYGIENLVTLYTNHNQVMDEICRDHRKDPTEEKLYVSTDLLEVADIADETLRNPEWEVASSEDQEWSSTAFGILPWQKDSLAAAQPVVVPIPAVAVAVAVERSAIVPGLLDDDRPTNAPVNWDSVLRKKKRPKRKRYGDAEVMVDRAIQMVKKRHVTNVKD